MKSSCSQPHERVWKISAFHDGNRICHIARPFAKPDLHFDINNHIELIFEPAAKRLSV